jgi:tRNA-uridine 2-sulfurtransferase
LIMTIAVAMSGGVDSSTAAAILAEQYARESGSAPPVVGLTMQLWNQRRLPGLLGFEPGVEPGRAAGRCCSLDDVYDARRVANFLGIPYYVINFEQYFEEAVVRPFVDQYMAGETPIPCSLCNTEIKFEQFVKTANQIGADQIATGHYARIRRDEQTGRYHLLAARDRAKDQSYFLFGLTQRQLSRSLFPLGEYSKEQVRSLARSRELPVAEKPESQEICFVPKGSYRQFIQAYLAEQGRAIEDRPGELVGTNGELLGEHAGVHRFTVGQRRGLGLAAGSPLYVIDIEAKNNRVTVGRDEDLFKRCFTVRDVNWIRPVTEGECLAARVRIRNKHVAAPARIEVCSSGDAVVEFCAAQRAITPGQAAVFYDGDEVLGGGWIARGEK